MNLFKQMVKRDGQGGSSGEENRKEEQLGRNSRKTWRGSEETSRGDEDNEELASKSKNYSTSRKGIYCAEDREEI